MTLLSDPAAGAPARTAEWGYHGLLLMSLVASLGLQGAVEPGAVQQVLVAVLLGTSLVLSFVVALAKPWLLRLVTATALVAVACSVLKVATGAVGDGEARLINACLVALAPPAVVVGVLRSLREYRAVRVEAVMGVLSVYLLLGFLFAFVYGALDRFGGNPFFTSATPATVANCLYYSFVTLATVGYGDLTARTDLGHTLSVFEALTGQIYLVTVVSLIVSNLGRGRARGGA
jgi:hypothetical protein